MKSLLENYESLIETLEEVSKGYDDYARTASGLLALMAKFSTYFGIRMAYQLFSITDLLATQLQTKESSCSNAHSSTQMTIDCLSAIRTESKFTAFYEEVCASAEDLQCDEPKLPRKRKAPRRYDDGSTPHIFEDCTSYFRQQYFEAIDFVVRDLQQRIHQKTFEVANTIEALVVNNADAEKEAHVPPTMLRELYGSDIDFDRLEVELTMLPQAGVEKPVTFQAVAETLTAKPDIKHMLTEVDKLIQIYLTIPVTTATEERSFSVLRRTKTYLRTTMTQKRLNHCMMLHCHKQQTDALDVQSLKKTFVSTNERRVNFFA